MGKKCESGGICRGVRALIKLNPRGMCVNNNEDVLFGGKRAHKINVQDGHGSVG